MKARERILTFSQCEKIKSGLIWVSHGLESLEGLEGLERAGAEKLIMLLMGMILQEVHVAKNIASDASLGRVEKHIEKAKVMLNSGVGHEAAVHLTRALSEITNIGQRAIAQLKIPS